MEYIKKIMTVIGLITITSLLLGSVTKFSEDGGNENILTMRVVESTSTRGNILIIDENGKSETIELKPLSKEDSMGKVTGTLNDIANRGYKLVSTVGTALETTSMSYSFQTTYIFVKKQN